MTASMLRAKQWEDRADRVKQLESAHVLGFTAPLIEDFLSLRILGTCLADAAITVATATTARLKLLLPVLGAPF